MATKPKYYVVWKGKKPGIYNNWNQCKKQIEKFPGAQYKSFDNLKLAEKAFSESYAQYKGKKTTESSKSKKASLTQAEKAKYGKPTYPSIAVDAACSGNPGKMEYQGVDAKTGKKIFHQGPMFNSTNNIGEFLALVHALAFLKKHNSNSPIYSDSKIAIGWVKAKKARTKLKPNAQNKDSFQLIARAENWLKNNTYSNPILKWETKAWGEIPADFGRK